MVSEGDVSDSRSESDGATNSGLRVGDRVRILPDAHVGQVVETGVDRDVDVDEYTTIMRLPEDDVTDQEMVLVRYDWKPGGGVEMLDRPNAYIVLGEKHVNPL